ncbi:hemocyte protein-glutamine gamma-glutamyltransferase-like protein, partial [Leptotrombidium deliense]
EREYYRVATNALNLSYILQEVTGRAIKDEILLNVTQLTKSDPMIGEPLKFNITFKNKMLTKKDIYVTVNISSVYYYGVVANTILYTPDMYFNLKPGETKFYDVEVGVSEYMGKLVEFAMVNVDVMAHGKKRDDLWTEQRSVQFQKPKVNVTVKGDAKANIPITLDIRFK